MDYYLKLENCIKLKEWGCNVDSDYVWTQDIQHCEKMEEGWISCWDEQVEGSILRIMSKKELFGYNWNFRDLENNLFYFNAYDIREIVCNGEIFKKFFDNKKNHSLIILELLQQNKKQEAEKYLMKETIFNIN